MKLEGKICAITGGGDGIGRAASLKFADEGATVVILELNETSGLKTQNDILARGGKARFIQTDISSPDAVRKAFEEIKRVYGRLDALYNNASVFLGGKDARVTDLDISVWKKILSINLDGTFYCCKYAIPLMIASGGGAIVNTSSSAGVTGIPECDAYTATKGAMISLTRSMAVEYAPKGVRVNCIAPAAILTDMVKESNLNDPGFDEEKWMRTVTPVRRWGLPEEVASVACFLASGEASYLNGAIIRADGGITINGTVNASKDD